MNCYTVYFVAGMVMGALAGAAVALLGATLYFRQIRKGVFAEFDGLRGKLDEWNDYYHDCLDESCQSPDELHCTCVPGLRKEIERLNALWTAAEESCLYLRDEVERLK